MTTITTTRHKTKFYLTVIFGALFFIGMGTVLLSIYFEKRELGNTELKTTLLPIFSIAVYALAFYTVYSYRKNAPAIQVNKHFISFNNQTYALDELEHIELTGKRSFPFVISFPMEGAALQFRNGETKYIYDDMHENAWQVKSFLKQVVIDKKSYQEKATAPIEKSELQNEWYDTFKGDQLTSMRGLMLWGFLGFIAFMLLTKGNNLTAGTWFSFGLFFTGWFLLHSRLMHYFKVSDKFLVVKKHNLTWKTKAYYLKDIDEVVFETQGKMPNCLRVITKDYRTKMYPAGTLRDKTWLALQDKLEHHNIKVRNECIL